MVFLRKNFYILFFSDLAIFFASFLGAYMLRFDFNIPQQSLSQFWKILPFMVLAKSIAFIMFGLYRGMWRYTSLSDLWKLLKATAATTLLISAFILFSFRFQGFSRAVFLLDWGLTLLLAGGIRLLIRVTYTKGIWGKDKLTADLARPNESKDKGGKKRVVIVGAGSAGEKLIREINENRALLYKVQALVDDDPDKYGKTIHGVPVMGSVDELPRIVAKCRASEILIAMPSASGPQMRRVLKKCEACALPFKTLPGIGELVQGRISVKELRDINYEDLLGRPQVKIDTEAIKSYITGAKVLITGAGGSIGSELCRQISSFEPELMVLLDAGEANLFHIQMELKHRLEFPRYVPVLADVKNAKAVTKVFERYGPDVVVHAAAYKHVPMLERNPWEAVRNNISGTHNLIAQSVSSGVSRFVMVSTDKAVRPTNVMGASKRVCELLMQAYQGDNGCRMMCVRFGNVVGSSGSVVPLFREQIARGGPVTVTHPEVTRYFMTIPEACRLIIQAGALGMGGEVFILQMGEPIRIMDMAMDLIRLSGKEPNKDIEIVVTGLRPGEKLYEELIMVGEGIEKTPHEEIMVLKSDGNWGGHDSQDSFKGWLLQKTRELEDAASRHDSAAIKAKLKEIVPEYVPSESEGVL